MISIARPQDGLFDWDGWITPLDQFSQATGLTVSAYDTECVRQVGPLQASRIGRLLATSTLWDQDGPGSALERRIVAHVLATDVAAPDDSFHGLRVCSLPLTQFGKVYGVLVFGWCFNEFTSPMVCDQIAALIGLPGHLLWNDVRLQAPVSPARMATYRTLLATLAGSIDSQRETIEELNRVNRARELFLATVSHEMRTPLSALSMRLEVMLRTVKDLPPPVETGLLAMRMHVRQEASMIEDLIDAARTLTGQMSIARAPVSLGRVLRDALATIEVSASEKRIALSITPVDYGDSITLAADPRRLQQVFWNLLLNAVKFTPEDGAIALRVSASAALVQIDVTDSGQGIEAADLPHVFGAFTLQTQGNSTGLGLGLYVARRIVELHGGTITVTSPGRGNGTTFSIRLPLD